MNTHRGEVPFLGRLTEAGRSEVGTSAPERVQDRPVRAGGQPGLGSQHGVLPRPIAIPEPQPLTTGERICRCPRVEAGPQPHSRTWETCFHQEGRAMAGLREPQRGRSSANPPPTQPAHLPRGIFNPRVHCVRFNSTNARRALSTWHCGGKCRKNLYLFPDFFRMA